MLNLSNILSISRAGFALCFLQTNPLVRLSAVALAMISDFLDGFLARRQGTVSQFGAILDPLMDKFFVFFAGGVLFLEKRLLPWELGALLSRDLAICGFGAYLALIKRLKEYECRAIFWGKISTVLQFIILIAITLHAAFPSYVYQAFVWMALFAFLELLIKHRRCTE